MSQPFDSNLNYREQIRLARMLAKGEWTKSSEALEAGKLLAELILAADASFAAGGKAPSRGEFGK